MSVASALRNFTSSSSIVPANAATVQSDPFPVLGLPPLQGYNRGDFNEGPTWTATRPPGQRQRPFFPPNAVQPRVLPNLSRGLSSTYNSQIWRIDDGAALIPRCIKLRSYTHDVPDRCGSHLAAGLAGAIHV
ncbi:hypothetical protein DFH06DRAFT_1134430 [Mycena polygramma]|nr:hypothetical protein DFH06DRAFT_1134430 [Mycena polygramma]